MRVLLVKTRQVTEIFGLVLEGAGDHVLLGKNVVNPKTPKPRVRLINLVINNELTVYYNFSLIKARI